MTPQAQQTQGGSRGELGEISPSLDEFRELAGDRRVIPVSLRLLADADTPLTLYRKLAGDRAGTFLLESAENGRSWSRWSFVGVRSPAALTVRDGRAVWTGTPPEHLPSHPDPIRTVREVLQALRTEPLPGMPPMTGGMVGYIGYDAVRRLEPITEDTVTELDVPEMVMLLATDLAALDHHEGTVTLIANAVNWDDSPERVEEAYADSVARLRQMVTDLATAAGSAPASYRLPEPEFQRRRSETEHHAAIGQAKQAIHDGEAFQVVLSQRFEAECEADALDVYRILRTTNPSPYMYLLRLTAPDPNDPQVPGTPFDIVGSSPEALVTVHSGTATTHPIAGTRWRSADPDEDLALEKDLLADDKERAEHLMLVDLGRNDLSRVCEPGSVHVADFFRVERYSHVMHIVSTLSGQLRPESTAFDAVTACFPAGTLSGAPKPRALQLIEQLEPSKRGPYGGIVGYLDFAGDADTAITIRTAVLRQGRAYVQAGGGIVADSDPAAEDAECLNKARAVLQAVATAGTLRDPGLARAPSRGRDGRG